MAARVKVPTIADVTNAEVCRQLKTVKAELDAVRAVLPLVMDLRANLAVQTSAVRRLLAEKERLYVLGVTALRRAYAAEEKLAVASRRLRAEGILEPAA